MVAPSSTRPNEAPGTLRLAVASDGELHTSTLQFLADCGVPVERSSPRRYTASLAGLPGVVVLFQRHADIPHKVEEGSADLGIVGLDRFAESHQEGGDTFLVMEDLGYARCELVLAVPEAWLDVTSLADLADLAVDLHRQGRDLRVATKYPRLTRAFLHSRGVHFFTLVPSSGTLEAAPAMGFADLITDIASTGTTLRENRLKTLPDGTILASQACLIGNRRTLRAPAKLVLAQALLERLEARLRARGFYRVTANVRGESAEEVASRLLARRPLAGVRGPTIARVHSHDGGGWYAVSVLVEKARLMEMVDFLRGMGGNGIAAVQPTYLFQDRCEAYERLRQEVGA